jgi:hypothetical protein
MLTSAKKDNTSHLVGHRPHTWRPARSVDPASVLAENIPFCLASSTSSGQELLLSPVTIPASRSRPTDRGS